MDIQILLYSTGSLLYSISCNKPHWKRIFSVLGNETKAEAWQEISRNVSLSCSVVTTALALTFLLMPGDATGILEARSKMPAYDDDVIKSQKDVSLSCLSMPATNQPPCSFPTMKNKWANHAGSVVRVPPTMLEMRVWIPGRRWPPTPVFLQEGHMDRGAWELQSMGSRGVEHNWAHIHK